MACVHKRRKFLFDAENIKIYQCNDCGLVFRNKTSGDRKPSTLYGGYYKDQINFGRFRFGLEYLIRGFRLFRAFKIHSIHPKAKSILDIGSGRGFMLYFLRKYFKYTTAVGTQIEKKAYEFSRKKLGLEIYNQDLLKINFKRRRFDVITIWHVLEHISNPEKYVQFISKILNKGGKLIIEVPNYNSWTSRLAGKYWLGLDLKYHLYFFTKDVLITLLEKYGLKVRKTQTFSLEYSAFISTQSLLSKLTETDQLFFNWIQGGKFELKLIYHTILFIVLFPVCQIINLFLYFSDKGEVLLVIAEKDAEN